MKKPLHSIIKGWICHTIAGLLLMVYTSMQAQDSLQSSAIDSLLLDSVTVSVKKLSEIQKEQASYFFDISPENIKSGAGQSTADLLQATGKVMVQKSQQGGGSPVLRGFEANKILLVVDGVRLNNLIYRGGHLQNIITVDPLSLQSIDVMMGQGSTLYGSDALGGVIHMRTLMPPTYQGKNATETNFYTKYSSANKGINAHLDIGHSTKNWSSITSLSYGHYGDLRMGSRSGKYPNERLRRNYIITNLDKTDQYVTSADPLIQVHSGYMQIDALQKLIFRHKNKARSTLNLQYSHSGTIPRYDRLTTTTDTDSLKYAEWYYGPQLRVMAAYEYEQYIPEYQSTLSVLGSYQNLLESRYKRLYLDSNRSANEENVKVYSLTTTLQKSIQNGYLESGLDFNLGTVKSVGYALNIHSNYEQSAQSRYPDGNNSQLNIALFALRHWDLSASSFLDVGLRAGHTSLRSSMTGLGSLYNRESFTQNNWVYSVDFSYSKSFQKGFHISANLGTGYRVPNLDDLAKIFDSAPGYLIVPNNRLKPEETINLNLNLSYKSKNKVQVQVSPFVSRLVNAIAIRPYQLNGQDSVMYDGILSQVVANQNQEKAWLTGVNADLKLYIIKNLNLVTNFSYTYGQSYAADGSQSPLDHIPPVTGLVALQYQRSIWQASLDCRYNGWKRLDRYGPTGEDNLYYAPTDQQGNPQGMPSWYTFNLKSGVNIKKHWSLNLGVENILDLRYQVFASGILAPGRNVFVSIQWASH